MAVAAASYKKLIGALLLMPLFVSNLCVTTTDCVLPRVEDFYLGMSMDSIAKQYPLFRRGAEIVPTRIDFPHQEITVYMDENGYVSTLESSYIETYYPKTTIYANASRARIWLTLGIPKNTSLDTDLYDFNGAELLISYKSSSRRFRLTKS